MPPALALYLALSSVAEPAARIILRRRAAAGKEDSARLSERLGRASLPRPIGPLAWFHAASVGEGLSLLPLLDRLRSERGDVAVLVTSGTVTSAALLAKRLPAGAIHQFVPMDVGPAVSRFLDHWRPDLAVWIESEIWPRLLRSVGERRIPALLLNARLSARSSAGWRHVRASAGELFGLFDYIQAQDEATASALGDLGVRRERLHLAGSFKKAAAPLPCDETDLERLSRSTEGRLVWTATSTHPGEEELAISAHARLLAKRPDALLILAPRHPERGDDVARLLTASGLGWSRRRDGPPGGVSVYLADTLGELGLWYRLATVAYVGGSAGGVGGHNPYEPIALGAPVLHGPDTTNFAAAYRELGAAEAARTVGTAEELAMTILTLDGAEGQAMAERAKRVVGSGEEALGQAVRAVLQRLPGAQREQDSGGS